MSVPSLTQRNAASEALRYRLARAPHEVREDNSVTAAMARVPGLHLASETFLKEMSELTSLLLAASTKAQTAGVDGETAGVKDEASMLKRMRERIAEQQAFTDAHKHDAFVMGKAAELSGAVPTVTKLDGSTRANERWRCTETVLTRVRAPPRQNSDGTTAADDGKDRDKWVSGTRRIDEEGFQVYEQQCEWGLRGSGNVEWAGDIARRQCTRRESDYTWAWRR
jgi:hypothetical protein